MIINDTASVCCLVVINFGRNLPYKIIPNIVLAESKRHNNNNVARNKPLRETEVYECCYLFIIVYLVRVANRPKCLYEGWAIFQCSRFREPFQHHKKICDKVEKMIFRSPLKRVSSEFCLKAMLPVSTQCMRRACISPYRDPGSNWLKHSLFFYYRWIFV